ncbi:MAG: lytic transglycosylase domain-containing protein [Burkholderiales bacterium]|nr:lytic transglycosylase domain-containing protein [Burkholderiales bacterium]
MNSFYSRLAMQVPCLAIVRGVGSKRLSLLQVLSCFLLHTVASNCCSADIYFSIGSDGSNRYATSALDASYQLLQQGDTLESTHNVLPPPAPLAARLSFLQRWLPHLRQLSQQHQVDLALILAIIEVESRYNPQAVSPKGAAGLMQLMPSVAQRYGAPNPHEIARHLQAGVMYLRDLQKLHPDNLALVLAAYNAGQSAILKHGQRIPPFKETMLYVPQVLAQRQLLRSIALDTRAPLAAEVVTP